MRLAPILGHTIGHSGAPYIFGRRGALFPPSSHMGNVSIDVSIKARGANTRTCANQGALRLNYRLCVIQALTDSLGAGCPEGDHINKQEAHWPHRSPEQTGQIIKHI